MDKRKVIIRGQVFRWDEKAPFVVSGKSTLGAIEYDSAEDTIKCHECGMWFKSLAGHLKTHSIRAKDYRLRHGLRQSAALNGMNKSAACRASAIRSGLPTNARAHKFTGGSRPGHIKGRRQLENLNLRNACSEQLLARIKTIAHDLGKTPSAKELRERGFPLGGSNALSNGSSLSELMELAGLAANPRGGTARKFPKEVLIELLRDFYVLNKRTPGRRDWSSGSLPSSSTYINNFGSLANAYQAAGLLLVAAA